MKHVALSEFRRIASDLAEADMEPMRLESLSREMAMTAAAIPDDRNRLLATMQILGNLRDQLVARDSSEAAQALGTAIQALMQRERELPAAWAR